MADWTKTELRDRSLEFVGVKAAGQDVSAEDAAVADDLIDSVHDQLRKLGLAPFALTAVPMWAQQPLIKYLSVDLSAHFGASGQRLAEFAAAQRIGKRELAEQVAGYRHPISVTTRYF